MDHGRVEFPSELRLPPWREDAQARLMGVRAAKAVDWTARLSRAGLALSVAFVAIGTARDFGYAVPLDVAIARTLEEVAPQETLDARANAALDAGDVALARGLADLAAELGRPLGPETAARLAAAETPAAIAWRNAKDAAHGFVTGEIEGTASLAGSLASDLTLVGDVRDLASEGLKRARGEDGNDLILALAGAGVAITAATYATGGAGAPARAAVTVLKGARRAGFMTAEFAADLGRRLSRSGARAGGVGVLAKVGTELRAVRAAVGSGETVRLMKYVRSADELPELSGFAAKFGARSRAVAELTGKASLRAFKTSVRLGEMLMKHLWAAILWFGALLAGAVSNLGWRGLRFAAARV